MRLPVCVRAYNALPEQDFALYKYFIIIIKNDKTESERTKQKNKRRKGVLNDSPETPDRRIILDVPSFPSLRKSHFKIDADIQNLHLTNT